MLIKEGIITQEKFFTKLTQVQASYQKNDQLNKHNLSTVDAVIDDIIAGMPLDDKVRTANLDEDGVLVLSIGTWEIPSIFN